MLLKYQAEGAPLAQGPKLGLEISSKLRIGLASLPEKVCQSRHEDVHPLHGGAVEIAEIGPFEKITSVLDYLVAALPGFNRSLG